MAGNDVRVRLSPEGVREVQQALRRVQRESDRINRESARGVNRLTQAVQGFTRVARGLGITAVGTGVLALARNAGDAADQIQKLQLRVGGTAEDLSALAFLTRTNDVEFTQLVATLGRVGERYDLLRTGNADIVRQFRSLGLSFQDLEGLSTPEVLERIAVGLAAIEDPLDRSRVAVRLFGRSGNQLTPLLLDLAQRGLPGARDAARAFGLEFSQSMVDAAAVSNDQVALIDARVDGLATQFRAGFLPQILAATGGGAEGFEDLAEAAQDMGNIIGRVIRTVVAVLAIPVNFVTTFIRSLFADIGALGIALDQLLERDFAGVATTLSARVAAKSGEIRDAFAKVGQDAVDAFDAIIGKLPDPTPRPDGAAGGGGGGDDTDLNKLRQEQQRRLQLVRQTAQAEFSVRQAQRAREAAADQRALDQGLISLNEFLNRRAAAIRAAGDEQVRALEAQIQALQSASAIEPDVRAGQVAALEAQIAVARINTEQQLDALAADRVDRELDAKREILAVEEELLGLEGRRAEASRLALQAQTQALRERLRAAGQTSDAIEAAVARFESASLARLNFDEVVQGAEAAFRSLENARTRIEQDVQLGITTQLGAQERLLQLEQARLPVLQQIAAAALQAARATGDPALIAQAEELAGRVQQVAVSVELASNSFARFRDQAEQSGIQALTDFFADGIQQADSLKDAVKALARSVVDDLKRIAAQAVATSIVRGFSGAFGGGGSVSPAAAGGGLLSGPGTGTSDSITARVSDGEFIVRAASVAQPGVLSHLFDLNRRGAAALNLNGAVFNMPRFAEGGLAQTDLQSPFRGSLEIGLADGLELRDRPVVSDAAFLQFVRRHPRQISEALGR